MSKTNGHDQSGRGLTPPCEWCGRAIKHVAGYWHAVKGVERGYDPLACEESENGFHDPGEAGRSPSRSSAADVSGCDQQFVADVLHDCLSSFQNIEGDAALTFDRDGAVEYLLSPASGLRIEVNE